MRIPVCNSASPTEADFDILVQVMIMVMLLVAMMHMMMVMMMVVMIMVMLLVAMLMMMIWLLNISKTNADFDIFIQTLVGTTINCPIIISDQVEFHFFFSLHQLG